MNNILLAVCTCKQNLNKALFYENFLKKYNFNNYLFYHGEGISPSNKFVNLNTDDCYSNLTKKSFLMLDRLKNFEFDYLVKVDDDTFIDLIALFELNVGDSDYIGGASTLKTHIQNFEFYKEYLLSRSLKKNIDFNYTKNLSDFKYILGNFCILRKDLILKILNFIKTDKIYGKIPQEDISIGYVCDQIKANMLDLSDNIPFYEITNNISYHPIPLVLFNMFFNKREKNDRVQLCRKFLPLNKYFKK